MSAFHTQSVDHTTQLAFVNFVNLFSIIQHIVCLHFAVLSV